MMKSEYNIWYIETSFVDPHSCVPMLYECFFFNLILIIFRSVAVCMYFVKLCKNI
uniref:Uncharacterized protein n=1 Tax=Papilio xuthus TaxID=66420 RepID=I4DLR7_PAPXU|nr:unknown unsecreted protein [Papilio xuthus]